MVWLNTHLMRIEFASVKGPLMIIALCIQDTSLIGIYRHFPSPHTLVLRV